MSTPSTNLKIALVHDWILSLGGAERVLKVLHEMFPEAPIYTFFYNKKFTDKFLPEAKIKSSFLQKLYKLKFVNHKLFLPLLPVAAESFDLSQYDLVISSSIAFSKGLILKPKTRHICYCYSPTRFLWDWHSEYNKKQTWRSKLVQHFLRIWDRSAADRVDEFVAISKNVQERIKKYYNRDSVVIYPPTENLVASQIQPFQYVRPAPAAGLTRAEVGVCSQLKNNYTARNQATLNFRATSRAVSTTLLENINSSRFQNYFLIVSRLFPHKNIDIAIQAFNKLELPLVIVGSGPEFGKLRSTVENRSLIKLTGNVSDEDLAKYYEKCKAFIMPQEEDFGLTPLEAMQFGKPVLALKRGGALEYIEESVNGEFFEDAHPAVLADGVRRLNENYKNYSPLVIKKTAEKFSRRRFEEEVKKLINL
ncbi:MAG: glycosyltransferase [Candidatus Yanofskybacteria bacterium]|nr:glycosyltransferase [Candidatus Yanofskybacteria bacterium]